MKLRDSLPRLNVKKMHLYPTTGLSCENHDVSAVKDGMYMTDAGKIMFITYMMTKLHSQQ